MKTAQLFSLIPVAILLASCNGGAMSKDTQTPKTLGSIEPARLDALIASRIYFGHQSVGFNIIEGIGEVLKKEGGKSFSFIESRQYIESAQPQFLHSRIGQNEDPIGKIRDFDAVIRSGMGNKADIAFMKLCYVDVHADTDVKVIFDAYRETMARLTTDFPKTTFICMTAPLMSRQRGPKAALKRLLGRNVQGYEDNMAREKLNVMLRNEYKESGRLFDLAALEATKGDGSLNTNKVKGNSVLSLVDEYTNDGGHLNERGRRFIAEQLLVFLSSVRK